MDTDVHTTHDAVMLLCIYKSLYTSSLSTVSTSPQCQLYLVHSCSARAKCRPTIHLGEKFANFDELYNALSELYVEFERSFFLQTTQWSAALHL